MRINTDRIILVYDPCECTKGEGPEQEQILSDVPDVGTLVCPECGEDLVLKSFAKIAEKSGR